MAERVVFSANDLFYAYQAESAAAVRGLNLKLESGRYYGIVGPNGCGKTTLLDLLAGVKQPQQGRLLFQGRPLASHSRRDLALQLAYVPQEYRINFPFTVAEVVLMGRHPYIGRFAAPTAADWLVVDRVLESMDLYGLRDAPATALSGGEKQRVALARALAQDTPVLILDEPTASLDIRHGLDIQRIVRDSVRAQSRTVVAAMHDLNLAAAFCDELILLAAGRIFASGPTAQVLTPENIDTVFGVTAEISRAGDGGLRVAFRTEGRHAPRP